VTVLLEQDGGTVSIADATLQQLVVRAAESVDGARVRRRGLDLAVADGRARVALDLAAPYGVVLPELARAVQEQVAAVLHEMCDLEASVDVAVEELR
jgi:uncharacterized alkaline shock family protein YloU